jgi:hypothetical protein
MGPYIVPSQFCGPSDRVLTESWEGNPITKDSKETLVRRVAYLPPKELEMMHLNLAAGLSLRRQLRMGVDNTLFVYPTALDRFRNRYLERIERILSLTKLIELSFVGIFVSRSRYLNSTQK